MSLENQIPEMLAGSQGVTPRCIRKVVAAYNQVNAGLDPAFDELATPTTALL